MTFLSNMLPPSLELKWMGSKPTTTKPKSWGPKICKAQVEIPCSVKPLVHMKCIAELWHGSLLTITGIFSYTSGFPVLAKGLDIVKQSIFQFLEPEDWGITTLWNLSNSLPITWCNITHYLNLYLDVNFSCCLWDILRFFSMFCCQRPNLPGFLVGCEQTIKRNVRLSQCSVLNPWHKNVRSPGSCVRVQIIQTDCHVSTRTSTHTKVH